MCPLRFRLGPDLAVCVCGFLRSRAFRKEPRIGKRVTLAATVKSPLGDIAAYSIHLEVFCGIIGRIWQMNGAPRRPPVEGLLRRLL